MFDLGTFYQSKEWRTLLAQLRMERLDENGEIICEYCGKPITRKYDLIGHHRVELTEDNVNDLSISLNPENIDFVHHRCHNYIHNKLGYAVRQVYLVYGPPLAGKRTYVNENAGEGDLVVDLDNIWECVSGCGRYVHPNRLKAIVFMVRDALLDAVKYRRGKWDSAYIVGGYPLKSERERLCKELGAREVFVEADIETCRERLEKTNDIRADLREIWSQYIAEWFEKYEKDTPLDALQ